MHEGNLRQHREILNAVTELLINHIMEQKEGSLLNFQEPQELHDLLKLDDIDCTGDWSKILFWVKKYLEYSVKTDHPGFVNRMWVGANLPSIVGEMVAAVSNTSSCTFESAPVSTVMEKYMLKEMIELAGFKQGEGQMTTGSSNANMIAMMAARNETLSSAKSKGMFNQTSLHGFASEDAHYSIEKAANILGIGVENIRKIRVNSRGEMDIDHLQQRIEESRVMGALPFFVCGTAGTTVRGAYDSIPDLLKLRNEYGFWLHIDGAWGGAVLVSDRLRNTFMRKIEEVDSLTWDFHKMLGTSLICNVFLINNRRHTLGNVCSGGDDSYIFHGASENDVVNLGAVSLQCGRKVESLKWFLDWKFYGKEEFARRVEHSLSLCEYAEGIVKRADELELVTPRNSFNVCFRYRSRGNRADELNLQIRDHLYKNGMSLVGYAYHQNKPFLRLLLANKDLDTNDIDKYFISIIDTGRQLEVTPQ